MVFPVLAGTWGASYATRGQAHLYPPHPYHIPIYRLANPIRISYLLAVTVSRDPNLSNATREQSQGTRSSTKTPATMSALI